MDYKFLDKVTEQIISETTIDMDEGRIYPPTSLNPYPPSDFSIPLSISNKWKGWRTAAAPFFSSPPFSFTIHCRDVYGLNEQEIKYVWKEYKDIIKDKIENNDL